MTIEPADLFQRNPRQAFPVLDRIVYYAAFREKSTGGWLARGDVSLIPGVCPRAAAVQGALRRSVEDLMEHTGARWYIDSGQAVQESRGVRLSDEGDTFDDLMIRRSAGPPFPDEQSAVSGLLPHQ